MRAMAPGGGRLGDAMDDADGVAGLAEQLREPRGLVAGQHDAGVLAEPVLDAVDEALRAARRQDRLAPAELVAAGQALRGERHALGRAGLRLPGELEGPRAVEARLPVARRQIRRRPVLRAGRPPRPSPRAAPRPGATGSRRHRRGRRARRGRGGSTGRGGRGPCCGATRRAQTSAASPAGSARPSTAFGAGRGVAGEAREVAARGARAGGRPCGRAASRISSAPPLGQQELGGGQERDLANGLDAALVGGVEGAQGVDLVAEQLDPDGQRRATAGRRRRCRPGARTRPGRRPRSPGV